MRWVRQEHAFGCIPASLAMVLGESYEAMCAELEAQQFSGHKGDWNAQGIDHHPMDRLLIDRGFFLRRVFLGWRQDPWPPQPFAPVHLAQVDQPSGNRHCVVMDAAGRVLDPLCEGLYALTNWSKVNNVVGLLKP